MTERPILFSGPMVRALLDGRKTQTRRIIKPQPVSIKHLGAAVPYRRASPPPEMPSATYEEPIPCPYGVPGDSLWVRETMRRAPHLWTYAADGTEVPWPARSDLAQLDRDVVVSIHMRRAASRLTLEITDVRAERLQDISEADAMAEGAEACTNGVWFDRSPTFAGSDARGAYYCLWNHINGAASWDANPWVWVVTFGVRVAA